MNLSTLSGAVVKVYFPNTDVRHGTIHETDNTFSVVVPPMSGQHVIGVVIDWFDNSDRGEFELKITPVQAAVFTLTTNPALDPVSPVFADIFDPTGVALGSWEMVFDGQNYSISERPGDDWYTGEYRAGIRDQTGYIDVYPFWIERPQMASMQNFFGLPEWHQQTIEFVKYEMMGDTDPLHPGAWFTLEEYAKFWRSVVREINVIPPPTSFSPEGVHPILADVMMKGTLLRVYHALANRTAPIPRWTGVNSPIMDESQLQQNWEQRYKMMREEYEEERAYAKGEFLAGPQISIDPFPHWMRGGNYGGTTFLNLIGKPTWYSYGFGGRGYGI